QPKEPVTASDYNARFNRIASALDALENGQPPRFVRRELQDDVATDATTLEDLTVDSLTVGNTYRLHMSVAMNVVEPDSAACLQATHQANELQRVCFTTGTGQGIAVAGNSTVFTAVTPTIEFATLSLSDGSTLGREKTFVIVEEVPGLVEIASF
ncbi:MAG: hypothetical protein AAGA48_36165, partial [Myxococcota bacterium]